MRSQKIFEILLYKLRLALYHLVMEKSMSEYSNKFLFHIIRYHEYHLEKWFIERFCDKDRVINRGRKI